MEIDIAVFGGAFDPPHRGHLFMAVCALRMGFCEKVWLMPSPDRPDKKMGRPFALRQSLLEMSLQEFAVDFKIDLQTQVVVSSFENQLGTFRGSLYLMQKLQEAFSQKQFGFILGYDTLQKINTWNDPLLGTMTGDDFLMRTPCLIFDRAGEESDLKIAQNERKFHAQTRLVSDLDVCVNGVMPETKIHMQPDFKYSQLSSTRVREELAKTAPDQQFLECAVGQRMSCELLREKEFEKSP